MRRFVLACQVFWAVLRGRAVPDPVLAELFFTSYNEQPPNPWTTWDNKDVPRWPALNDQVRSKWLAVASIAKRTLGDWTGAGGQR